MRNMFIALLIVAAAACDNRRDLETRTFQLQRLSHEEAIVLITPYVRDGGLVSGRNKLITVREREDRLKVIEEMLRKYDGMGKAADVTLRFRVIEANGFTGTDSAIADVEPTLKETFRYRGYRLVGETVVRAREESSFSQTVGETLQISGEVGPVYVDQNERRVPVRIVLRGRREGGMVELMSTVTASMGKPVVLGQSTSRGAIILVINPALVEQ